MKIFIVCSKYFYDRIVPVKSFLEERGHEIVLPNSFYNPSSESVAKMKGQKEHVEFKGEMFRKSKDKIKGVDVVLVLNLEKRGIPNYIGGATFLEIYDAWQFGKKIFFYNDLPNCSFTDELIGFDPVVINGDLEMVR